MLKIFFSNCQLAFSVAEDQLDITSLLDIKDMVESEQLDKRSILTYLSQFYHKFSKDAPTPVSRTSLKISDISRSFSSIPPQQLSTINGPNQDKVQFCNIKSDSATNNSNNSKSHSLPYTLNYNSIMKQDNNTINNKDVCAAATEEREEGGRDTTKTANNSQISSVVQNIAAIKSLVFENNNNSDDSTRCEQSSEQQLPMTRTVEQITNTSRESDSGVEQSSESSSSTSSSRLSSVSPSFSKSPRQDKALMIARKHHGANLIIKPKRTHIITNNRINSHQTANKYSQGKQRSSINKSFQEAILKFNSLSVEKSSDKIESSECSGGVSMVQMIQSAPGQVKQLKSQSSQTDPEHDHPQHSLISQQCQTEESHLVFNKLSYKQLKASKTHQQHGQTINNIKRSISSGPRVQGYGHCQEGYNVQQSRSHFRHGPFQQPRHGHQQQQRQQQHHQQQRPMTSLGVYPPNYHSSHANYLLNDQHKNYHLNDHCNNYNMKNGTYSTLV